MYCALLAVNYDCFYLCTAGMHYEITLSSRSVTLLALTLLTGGRGDTFCASPEAPVSWRLLSAGSSLSFPCQS